MRVKKFTCGITFFVTPEMYQELKQLSDEKQIAISELLRSWIANAFEREKRNLDKLPGDTRESEMKEKERQEESIRESSGNREA